MVDVPVPESEFSSITKIEISNFESFQNYVVIKDIQHANNFIGLYDTVKKDIFAAIYFALGATATDLRVTHLAELKNKPDATMFVQLEIKALGIVGNQIVRRELREPGNVELLFDNLEFNQPLTMDEYLRFLKTLKFDFQKQFYFYDAYNRAIVCNKFTCEQDELIAVLTDSTNEIRRLHHLCQLLSKLEEIGYRFLKMQKYSRTIDLNYKKLLPTNRIEWASAYAAFVTSHLKRQEAERIYIKNKLQTVVAKLAVVDANIQNCQHIIDAETVARDAKVKRNLELMEIRQKNWDEILKCTQQPGLPDTATVLSMNIELLDLRNLMQKNRILIDNNKALIRDLERYKIAAESNITFMVNATGTRRKSNMITEDALLKIYPIYHGSDQCKMDMLELKYLEKQEELNSIEHKIENFRYFETVLPLQRFKQVDDDELFRKMETELSDTRKDIVHPNAYLLSFDEMKLDELSSMIPSSQGFVLCKALTAADDEHINLVRNILHDYKYTVVVYNKNDIKVISKAIEKSLPEWCENVKFLLLSDLSVGRGRTEYIPPTDHWLNYCTYASGAVDYTDKRKLMHHLGKQKLNIMCVESHETVREEFKRKSKKYVASIDGQLIYTRSMIGIDVLMYFAPGKEVKYMDFPDACERLTDAHSKFAEWMSSTFAEAEIVPQYNNDVDLNHTNNLRAEVDRLKTDFLLKKDQQIHQMEALRDRMNRPYDVSDIQNYAQPLVVEQDRLNAMNARIIELQNEITDFERIGRNQLQEQALWTDHIKHLTEFDKNEIEITQHNKTIKANEEQRNKSDESKVSLEVERDELNVLVKNLKYKTIGTIVLATREGINWADIECNPSPPNLFQAVANGEFIDPHQISTHFNDMTDTFNTDIFYGKQEWYNRLNRVGRAISELCIDIGVTHRGIVNERDAIYADVKKKQINLNKEINEILQSITQVSYPNMTIEYSFEMKSLLPRIAAQMIVYFVDGTTCHFEDFLYIDQVLVHWIVFAALHRYSRAPFVFIDLSNVPEEIIQMISPVIEQMSKNAQLFINSSEIFHIEFAEQQFALNVKTSENRENGEYTIQVVAHDSRQHIQLPDDSQRGPGDSEREPDEADRADDDGMRHTI